MIICIKRVHYTCVASVYTKSAGSFNPNEGMVTLVFSFRPFDGAYSDVTGQVFSFSTTECKQPPEDSDALHTLQVSSEATGWEMYQV